MYLRRDKNGQFVSCVTYNASALRIFNSSNSLVRFEDKMFFLYFDKKLPSLLQRRRYTYVVVNSEIAARILLNQVEKGKLKNISKGMHFRCLVSL
jgi:hypothetical protein